MRRIRNLQILLFLAVFVSIVTLCCSSKVLPVPDVTKGPYLQNIKTDGVTIMWETNSPAIGKVVYGKNRKLEKIVSETDSVTIHEILLSELEVETDYYYKIVNNELESSIYTFRTAVKENSPFKFAVYGDNKNGPFNHKKVADLILSKEPDLVFHTGDLVDRGRIYIQWEKLFFTPAEKMMRSIPLFPVLGNHEDHARNYYDFFSLPNNEQWYSFDYGNAHFVILDSDEDELEKGGEQLNWLIEDLENNTAEWTFVLFHHPPFTAGGNYYDKDRLYRKNLLPPIFEKYGVDIVFSGHDHDYERTFPIVSKNGKNPVTYIVCGNGGTTMRYVGKRKWTHYSERVFGFVLVDINGSQLNLKSINVENEVIDELALDKSAPRSIATYEKSKIFFEDIYDPVEAIQYYDEGDDLLDDEKFQEALVAFEKAYTADTTCVEALAGIAECYFEMQELSKAINFAKRGITKMYNYPDNYEVLCEVYLKRREWNTALEWARKWLQITSDSPDAYEQMSEIYAEQEQYILAIEAMKKALEIQPAEAELYFKLGRLYEEIGDRNNAIKSYQKGRDWFMDYEEYMY